MSVVAQADLKLLISLPLPLLPTSSSASLLSYRDPLLQDCMSAYSLNSTFDFLNIVREYSNLYFIPVSFVEWPFSFNI